MVFTSLLQRAIQTYNYAIDELGQHYLPVHKHWRLNEKHYGSLQGLNKSETAKKYGEKQVKIWRRSYDIAPAPLKFEDKASNFIIWRHVSSSASHPPSRASLRLHAQINIGFLKLKKNHFFCP